MAFDTLPVEPEAPRVKVEVVAAVPPENVSDLAPFNPTLEVPVAAVKAVADGSVRAMLSTLDTDVVLKLVPVLARVTFNESAVPSFPSIANAFAPADVRVNVSLPEPPVRLSAPPPPVTVNAVPVVEAAVAARIPLNDEALTDVTAALRAVVDPDPRRFSCTPDVPPVTVRAGIDTPFIPSVAAAAEAVIVRASIPAAATMVAVLVDAVFANDKFSVSFAVFAASETVAVPV